MAYYKLLSKDILVFYTQKTLLDYSKQNYNYDRTYSFLVFVFNSSSILFLRLLLSLFLLLLEKRSMLDEEQKTSN